MFTKRKIQINLGEYYGNVIPLEEVLVKNNSTQNVKHANWQVRMYRCVEGNEERLITPTSLIKMREVKARQERENKEAFESNTHQQGIRNSYFGEYKRNAKKGNINFNITFEDFNTLISQNCFYCGAVPTVNVRMHKRKHLGQPDLPTNGIDRIDSTKDYTLNNVVPCCAICNIMKNSLDQTFFLNHVKRINNFIEQSSTTIENTEKSGSE